MSESVKNINDILSTMDSIHNTNVYPVYIPSLSKSVMFKEMTTAQEKAIVKTIVDNPIHNSGFIFVIRDIIKQNCAEELDVDGLTIIDKTAICLTMRQKSVGENFEYIFKGTKKKKNVNISDILQKFSNIKILEPEVVSNDTYEITCKVPTILDEYNLEKEFHSGMENIEVDTIDKMKEAIGEVFINEVVKYISKMCIKTTGDEINLNDYDFKSRVQILEKLGNSLLQKILDYIKRVNTEYKEALSIDLELTDDERKLTGESKITGILEAGSDFFITS